MKLSEDWWPDFGAGEDGARVLWVVTVHHDDSRYVASTSTDEVEAVSVLRYLGQVPGMDARVREYVNPYFLNGNEILGDILTSSRTRLITVPLRELGILRLKAARAVVTAGDIGRVLAVLMEPDLGPAFWQPTLAGVQFAAKAANYSEPKVRAALARWGGRYDEVTRVE